VSTAPPAPSPKRRRRRWVRLLLAVLLALLAVPVVWLFVPWVGRDMFDSSIVVEGRRLTINGHVVENGRVYDQARVEFGGATELVLPETRRVEGYDRRYHSTIDVTVRADGEPGAVVALVEKRHDYHGDADESMYLRDVCREWKVWRRRTGSVLAVDVDPGVGKVEGGVDVRVIFAVPPGFPVRQEPVSSPAFSGRYEHGLRTWVGTILMEGWVEVPQQPLPRRQFR